MIYSKKEDVQEYVNDIMVKLLTTHKDSEEEAHQVIAKDVDLYNFRTFLSNITETVKNMDSRLRDLEKELNKKENCNCCCCCCGGGCK